MQRRVRARKPLQKGLARRCLGALLRVLGLLIQAPELENVMDAFCQTLDALRGAGGLLSESSLTGIPKWVRYMHAEQANGAKHHHAGTPKRLHVAVTDADTKLCLLDIHYPLTGLTRRNAEQVTRARPPYARATSVLVSQASNALCIEVDASDGLWI